MVHGLVIHLFVSIFIVSFNYLCYLALAPLSVPAMQLNWDNIKISGYQCNIKGLLSMLPPHYCLYCSLTITIVI
jgi:hypothetical protein